jgi:hypothetical protein
MPKPEKSSSDLDQRGGDAGAPAAGGVPRFAVSGPHEEVIVRYTVGTGRFTPDGKFIILTSKMFKENGEEDGHHEGVFQSRVADPSALLAWFRQPRPPLDAAGPVDTIEVRADTKAVWTFGDGSSIVAVGPAVVHLARFKDGSQMFFVSVAASITGGTGRFEGTLGIKTALGGTYLDKGSPFGPDTEFPGKTIETFRVIRASEIENVPPR